jgi:hypothetical protein
MKNVSLYIALLAFGLILGSCQKDLPNQPKANQPPVTRLWLSSPVMLNETSSRQHAYWYGEDPDGYVKGFLIATPESVAAASVSFPDTFSYSWTTRNDSILSLPLIKARSLFTIVARAVDNTFPDAAVLPEGAAIRLTPQPFWDVNTNRIYDAGDKLLPGLSSSIDRKSAAQLLPIKNTPPRVFFAVNPVDSATYQQPDTTFTVASFAWYGTDVDGDNTISAYRIALNDSGPSKRWLSLSGTVKFITLIAPRSVTDGAAGEVEADVYTGTFPTMQFRGKVQGLKLDAVNVLYLQAKDVAGDSSSTITMPSTPATKKWYVKKPKSKMLVVSDYNQNDKTIALNTYAAAIEGALPGKDYSKFDILDVGYGLTSLEKQNQLTNQKYGVLVPTYMNPALVHTLKLYDVVLWMSDLYPSYLPAQVGLFNYYKYGSGKVIFTTTFSANIVFAEVKALNDFAPIDSVSTDGNSSTTLHTNADGRMPIRTKVLSLSSGFPELAFDTITTGSFHTFNWRRIYKQTSAQYLYQLDSSKFYTTPFRYAGRPEVGVINNERSFVLIALPLHKLNGGNKNLSLFFKRVMVDEFGLN